MPASEHSHTFWPWAGATAVAVMLGIVAPATLTASGTQLESSSALVSAWLMTALSALALAFSFLSGKPNIMWLGFWMFCYLFLGLAAVVQISRSQYPLGSAVSSNYISAAGVLGLLGSLSWVSFYLVFRARTFVTNHRMVSPARGNLFVLGSVALSATYLLALGLANLFTSRQHISGVSVATFGSQTNASVATSLGIVPLALAFFVLIDRRRRGMRGWSALLVVTAFNIVASNPFINGRTWVGTLVLSALLMIGKGAASASRIRTLLVGWLVAFIVVLPYGNRFRTQGPAELVSIDPSAALSAGDYDSFNQTAYAMQYVNDEGMQWGQQLLGSIFFFVPRSIWPGKAEGTGVILGQSAGFDFTNLSAPLWAEGYVDFGVAGTVILLGVWGAVCGVLDRRFDLDLRAGSGIYLIGVPLLAFWQIVILRGSLIAVLPNVLAIFLCLLFLKGGAENSPRPLTLPRSDSSGTEASSQSKPLRPPKWKAL